jgi:hypothetical protein
MDGNGIFAHAPIRANSVWKLLGVSDSPRSDENTWEDAPCSRCARRRPEPPTQLEIHG